MSIVTVKVDWRADEKEKFIVCLRIVSHLKMVADLYQTLSQQQTA